MENAGKENLWQYNSQLKGLARNNRNNMTKAEACIWKFLLSGKQMMGFQFRRQRPVLNFIGDFLCKELMLIIEVDGITHQWEEFAEKDRIRTKKLKEVGFKVIRFTDDEVLNDIQNVSRVISCYIEEFQSKENLEPPF